MSSRNIKQLEEHLDKKLDDNKNRIDSESKRFDKAMRELGARLDEHAKQIGQCASDAHDANSSATKAWKETQKINQALKDARIYETAEIFVGGATIARGIISVSKVLAAISILAASAYGAWQAIIHWRPH